VNERVGNTRNDDAELLKECEPEDSAQGLLF
jgi:hypothetical protein